MNDEALQSAYEFGSAGRCRSCDNLYYKGELAGYNVRCGIIVSAICWPCVRYYGFDARKDTEWYSRIIKSIERKRKETERKTKKRAAKVAASQQTTLKFD